MDEDHPNWIWYGVDKDGRVIFSFGRWQSDPCQKRYKLAEIQATEHDHPQMKTQPATWSEVCAPIIARFEVGANFGADVVHNSKGAAAVAEIIKTMARKLDTEIAARRALTDLIPPEDIGQEPK